MAGGDRLGVHIAVAWSSFLWRPNTGHLPSSDKGQPQSHRPHDHGHTNVLRQRSALAACADPWGLCSFWDMSRVWFWPQSACCSLRCLFTVPTATLIPAGHLASEESTMTNMHPCGSSMCPPGSLVRAERPCPPFRGHPVSGQGLCSREAARLMAPAHPAVSGGVHTALKEAPYTAGSQGPFVCRALLSPCCSLSPAPP